MRKYLRFRLRTMFVIVALVSISMAYFTSIYRRGQKQIETVQGLSRFFVLHINYASDYTEDGQYKDGFYRQTAPETVWGNSQNQVIGIWWIIDRQYYSFAQVQDAVKFVGALPNLRHIHIDGRMRTLEDVKKFQAECLPNIMELVNSYDLRELSLIDMRLTDAQISQIAKLHGLERLSLRNCLVSDVGVGELCKLSKLRYFDLSDNSISDRSISNIKKMRRLESLNLSGNQLTPDGVRSIRATFPNIHVGSDLTEEEIH